MIPIRDTIPSKNTPFGTWILIRLTVWCLSSSSCCRSRCCRRFFIISASSRRATPSRVGRLGGPADRRLLAVSHQHVPPRRLAPHHRQHVDAVDLRRQRRGPHGNGALSYVLFYLRAGGGAGALFHQPRFDHADSGSLRRHRRRDGRLFFLFPTARVITLIPLFFLPLFVEIPAVIYLGFWISARFSAACSRSAS